MEVQSYNICFVVASSFLLSMMSSRFGHGCLVFFLFVCLFLAVPHGLWNLSSPTRD